MSRISKLETENEKLIEKVKKIEDTNAKLENENLKLENENENLKLEIKLTESREAELEGIFLNPNLTFSQIALSDWLFKN